MTTRVWRAVTLSLCRAAWAGLWQGLLEDLGGEFFTNLPSSWPRPLGAPKESLQETPCTLGRDVGGQAATPQALGQQEQNQPLG